MGRAKREMKRIEVEKCRLLTFQKRRKGLTKKISELVTLCGISACMICFGPDGSRFSGSFLWPDAQSMEIIFKKYFSINKAEREKRMLRLSDFVASKGEEENQEIASSSNNRDSESVSCDGSSSAASGGDAGSRAMRELLEQLEASSSVELLQEVVRKLDSRLAMVKERIKLLKVESLDLNQPLCGPSEEVEMCEGVFPENDGNKENAAAAAVATAEESTNQQQISIPTVLEDNSTSSNSNAASATAAGRMHSKGGLRFRRSSGSALLPSVMPPITALLPMDQEPSTR
ncbi:hypothetical protein ACLOJK_034661 [Asimina triloba]